MARSTRSESAATILSANWSAAYANSLMFYQNDKSFSTPKSVISLPMTPFCSPSFPSSPLSRWRWLGSILSTFCLIIIITIIATITIGALCIGCIFFFFDNFEVKNLLHTICLLLLFSVSPSINNFLNLDKGFLIIGFSLYVPNWDIFMIGAEQFVDWEWKFSHFINL